VGRKTINPTTSRRGTKAGANAAGVRRPRETLWTRADWDTRDRLKPPRIHSPVMERMSCVASR
jgi:hypothetical protein